jgi:hypothetical protein
MTNVRVYGRAAEPRSPLVSGLLAGTLIAAAWILLVYVVHHPVGVLAWAVGALIGVVIATVARPPTKATGTLAALLTLGTVVATKVGIVLFALQPIVRDELVRNRDAVAALYLVDRMEASDTMNEDAALRLVAAAEAWAASAPRAERERLVARYADRFVERLGFGILLLGTFGLLDLLWIGLGITTAWKVGQGIG